MTSALREVVFWMHDSRKCTCSVWPHRLASTDFPDRCDIPICTMSDFVCPHWAPLPSETIIITFDDDSRNKSHNASCLHILHIRHQPHHIHNRKPYDKIRPKDVRLKIGQKIKSFGLCYFMYANLNMHEHAVKKSKTETRFEGNK